MILFLTTTPPFFTFTNFGFDSSFFTFICLTVLFLFLTSAPIEDLPFLALALANILFIAIAVAFVALGSLLPLNVLAIYKFFNSDKVFFALKKSIIAFSFFNTLITVLGNPNESKSHSNNSVNFSAIEKIESTASLSVSFSFSISFLPRNAARISRNLTSSFLSFSISVSLKGFLFLIFGYSLLQFSEKFILINLPAAYYLLQSSIL